MSAASATTALAMAGLRDATIAELQHRGLCDLARLAGMSDRQLRLIPHVGDKAVAVIRAAIEAA